MAHAGLGTIDALKQCAPFVLSDQAMLLVSHGHVAAHQAQQELAELVREGGRAVKMVMPSFDQGVALGTFLADYLKRRTDISSIFVDGTKFVYNNPEQIERLEKELLEIVNERGIFAVLVFSVAE